jgi:hypothetical protein
LSGASRIVVCQPGVASLEERPERAIERAPSDLVRQVRAALRPLHLLALGEALADDGVHRGLWADAAVRAWYSRDYQAPLLHQAELVAAARREDWSKLSDILACIEGKNPDDVIAALKLDAEDASADFNMGLPRAEFADTAGRPRRKDMRGRRQEVRNGGTDGLPWQNPRS